MNIFSRIFKRIASHKLITAIIVIIIGVVAFFGYKHLKGNENTTRYVMATVSKGNIIVSLSGSGQVSASDQVDIKPKVSGDIINVGVENGQEVKKEALLVQIDDRDAQKAVQDAEISLETTKIALDQAQGDLKNSYEEGFNKITDAFSDFRIIMSDLQSILFGEVISPPYWNIDIYTYSTNYTESSENNIYYKSYHNARSSYEKNLADYQLVSRSSDENTIESLIKETYQTTKILSETIKNINNLIQLYEKTLKDKNLTINPIIDTYLSNLSAYTDKINTHLLDLLSTEQTIQTAPVDIKSKELTVKQNESALLDAKEKLADYSIYAPFDGVVAEIDIKNGDSVSANAVIATLITNQMIAEITLNEVDVAKIKIGEKVTLTFDALPDLTISGKVLDIDTLGTVSQGVVSYGVKIAFDTLANSIKSGMSVTADIITDIKQDVLILPNTAIKTQGISKYVELVTASDALKQQLAANVSGVALPIPPTQQSIETGISNDTSTEIVSGLKEGDIVVASTVSSSTSSNSSTTNSSQTQIRIPGVGGFEGGR